MNKQLVAFLSMLSLVLVLSVYYVMLPFENVPTTNSQNVSSIITTTDDAYFASLAAEQDNNYDFFCKIKKPARDSDCGINKRKIYYMTFNFFSGKSNIRNTKYNW